MINIIDYALWAISLLLVLANIFEFINISYWLAVSPIGLPIAILVGVCFIRFLNGNNKG